MAKLSRKSPDGSQRPLSSRKRARCAGGKARATTSGPVSVSKLKYMPSARSRTRAHRASASGDRKSVVSGKRVSVRVDLGGRRILKKKKTQPKTENVTENNTNY